MLLERRAVSGRREPVTAARGNTCGVFTEVSDVQKCEQTAERGAFSLFSQAFSHRLAGLGDKIKYIPGPEKFFQGQLVLLLDCIHFYIWDFCGPVILDQILFTSVEKAGIAYWVSRHYLLRYIL